MPYTELLKWIEFFRRQPYGWREDYRAGVIAKSMGYKGSIEELFPSVKQLKASEEESQVPDKAVPKGLMYDLMMKSKYEKGSELPDWMKNGNKG